MESTFNKFENVCRVCLCESKALKSLLEAANNDERCLVDILSFATNIKINLCEKLPTKVCGDCETIMYKADAFKRRCLETDDILCRYLDDSMKLSHTPCLSDYLPLAAASRNKYMTSIENSSKIIEDDDKNALKNCISHLEADISVSNKNHSLVQIVTNDDKNMKIKLETTECKIEYDYSDQFDGVDNEEISPISNEENLSNHDVKSYMCYCGSVFYTHLSYKLHLKTQNCIKYKKELKKMMAKSDNAIQIKNKIVCKICNCQFTYPQAWLVHQQTHIGEKKSEKTHGKHKCTKCERQFKSKSLLAAHILRHDVIDNTKYICEHCKREFKYKAYLNNHIQSLHTEKIKMFTCDFCKATFATKEALAEHEKSHNKSKKHQCKFCGKCFIMLCTLKEHLRTHTGEKPFLCSFCGRGFSQKNNLAQHVRRHEGFKPHKCDNCGKGFVSKGELEAHSRKHSGAHPFKCDDCGNGFTTSSALVKHRRIHTGERPYACDFCPMRFSASGTLTNHRRTHTGEKPYQCSYCEKAFVQRNDLVSHIRCHTGERPYVCTQCGQAFRKASGLKIHLKFHSKEEKCLLNAGELMGTQ